MRRLRSYIRVVGSINDKVGNVVSFMVLFMMFILVWEVIMRYGFDSPTFWAHESSQYFFGAHFILGGAYALLWGAHVNVEILYERFPARTRAIIDLFTWALFYLFCGFLLWNSLQASITSVSRLERTESTWGPPLWPLRLTIPLAALLILLQGTTKTIKDVYMAITGRDLTIEPNEKGEL